MSAKVLAIDLIKTDGGTQMRAELSVDVYMDYRDKILAGVEFPPLDVFFDGSEYWLADGFHRFYGHREAKRGSIKANVHNGTKRDAILFAVGANQGHGLRRTNPDKRNCVVTLLNDPEWVKWSNNKVAEAAGVSDMLVSDVRKQLQESCSSPAAKTKDEPKIGKDGKSRKAPAKKPKTTGTDFGTRSKPAEPEAEKPKISGGTSFDVAEIEAAQAAEVPFAEKVRLHNLELERYCQRILKAFKDDVPASAWLDDSRHGIVGDSINSAVDTVRAVKAFDKPCPRCSGSGKLGTKACHWCKACGFMPERSYEMAGGQ